MVTQPRSTNESVQADPPARPRTAAGIPPGTGGQWLTARRAVLTSLVITLIALVMDIKGLMVIPMTSTFIREAGMSPYTTGWVLLAAQLVGAATIGLLGRMGDVHGHRKIMLILLLGQLIGNALTGLAVHPLMIIAGRSLVGVSVGAALMLPIMRDWMRPADFRRGLGFFGGVQGIGVAISFLFSGFFLSIGWNWRAVFLICAGLSLICLVTTWKWVPETRHRASTKVDYLGAVLLGTWMCFLLIAISRVTTWGVASVPTLGCLAAAAVVCAVWVGYERRHPSPLVAISVAFGHRLLPVFVPFATMSFVSMICYIGVSNFVQAPRRIAGYGFSYSVLQSGLVLLPMSLIIGLSSMFVGHLITRFGARFLMTIGSTVMGAVLLYWYWNHSQAWEMVLGAAVFGIGSASVFCGGYAIVTVEAAAGSVGVTNAVLILWGNLGSTIGTAASTALTSNKLIPGTRLTVEAGWSNTFLVGMVVALLGALVSLAIRKGVGAHRGAAVSDDRVRRIPVAPRDGVEQPGGIN